MLEAIIIGVSGAIAIASTVTAYIAQGITNAKLKANNRNQIFLSIYANR